MATASGKLLNGDEIKARGFIEDDVSSGYKAATYDIRIGDIMDSNGTLLEAYTLPPQGIVRVISQEKFKIPADITGHALVKTSLCDEAILAINIGLIDPLYSGPLSSSLINFGKLPHVVSRGDTFLRLTFFECNVSSYAKEIGVATPTAYVTRTRKNVL